MHERSSASSPRALAAGDPYAGPAPQLGETAEVVAVERLFEPVDAELLQFFRDRQRRVQGPRL
jgi:hypothetical protein